MESDDRPDVILATDMLDLTTFLALSRRRVHQIPAAIYMHENQLTYPLPADGAAGPMRRQLGERDRHYAFVNFASMLAAELVLFNSGYHRDSFFQELPKFLRHFPEYNELGTVETVRAKSEVLSVGVNFERLAREADAPGGTWGQPGETSHPPLILWNQRWEYDKNPGDFFRALYAIKEEGIPFRLALCGQQFGQRPPAFEEGLNRLSSQLVHVGYASEETYREWLWEASITISTAHHEFFGISILEAIGCRTFPILPHRLSYPELIPEPFHLRCLYENQGGLVARLRWALTKPDEAVTAAAELASGIRKYGWPELAPRYDAVLEGLAAG
jgi:glycosyltransferase involved in cell wall biosynthesis